MAYCTVEEVFAMFKEDALNTLAGTDYIEDPEERSRNQYHLRCNASVWSTAYDPCEKWRNA